MGVIPIIVLKLIEILQVFPDMWRRLERWLGVSTGRNDLSLYHKALERGLGLEKKTVGGSFQRQVGFRDIAQVNWKSPLGSPLSFLPCRVPWTSLVLYPIFKSFLTIEDSISLNRSCDFLQARVQLNHEAEMWLFPHDSPMLEGTHFLARPEPNMAQGRKHRTMRLVLVFFSYAMRYVQCAMRFPI